MTLISNDDRGVIACSKTLFIRNDEHLYNRTRKAIEAFNKTQLSGDGTDFEKQLLMEGASLLYQLINNEDFLKDYK